MIWWFDNLMIGWCSSNVSCEKQPIRFPKNHDYVLYYHNRCCSWWCHQWFNLSDVTFPMKNVSSLKSCPILYSPLIMDCCPRSKVKSQRTTTSSKKWNRSFIHTKFDSSARGARIRLSLMFSFPTQKVLLTRFLEPPF